VNPRERILTALNHEPPDRTPVDGWFHPEVVTALKRHFDSDDWDAVLARLGIDGWADLSPWIHFSDWDAQAVPRPGGADGPRAIWLDEQTYVDGWGIRFRFGEGDRYQRWLSGPLESAETPDDVLRYRFPVAADIREPDDYARRVAELKARGRFVTGEIDNPYKRFWHLRGYENALMDYRINVPVLEAVYDRLYPLATELALRMVRAGVDMVKVVGDVAMQDRIIMGPELWRRYDKPRWAPLIEACRAVNPQVAFFFHSDGKLTDLMDDLVEVGFTVINPIQPECMDPVEVKRRWGDRITLHGGISIQRTLPFGTPDEVRREVEALIRACGYNGGLVMMPSNNIQPDTPIENILACYAAARDLDVRKL
jgi:uroporphyrinogen decarboxylase